MCERETGQHGSSSDQRQEQPQRPELVRADIADGRAVPVAVERAPFAALVGSGAIGIVARVDGGAALEQRRFGSVPAVEGGKREFRIDGACAAADLVAGAAHKRAARIVTQQIVAGRDDAANAVQPRVGECRAGEGAVEVHRTLAKRVGGDDGVVHDERSGVVHDACPLAATGSTRERANDVACDGRVVQVDEPCAGVVVNAASVASVET